MTPDGLHSSRSRLILIASALTASLVVFMSFTLNVLYGKFTPFFGWDAGLRLPPVPEFWLLFTSAAFFVVAALAAEQQAGGYPPPAPTNQEDSNHEKRQGSH